MTAIVEIRLLYNFHFQCIIRKWNSLIDRVRERTVIGLNMDVYCMRIFAVILRERHVGR
jgi:hypothetical protein